MEMINLHILGSKCQLPCSSFPLKSTENSKMTFSSFRVAICRSSHGFAKAFCFVPSFGVNTDAAVCLKLLPMHHSRLAAKQPGTSEFQLWEERANMKPRRTSLNCSILIIIAYVNKIHILFTLRALVSYSWTNRSCLFFCLFVRIKRIQCIVLQGFRVKSSPQQLQFR